MVTIVHDVLVERMSHKDVAVKHQVTQALVSNLVCRARKHPEFLKDVRFKEELVVRKVSTIAETA